MSTAFSIIGPLSEQAIRHVVREAAGQEGDAKTLLVAAAIDHLASEFAHGIVPQISFTSEMAELMGTDFGADFAAAVPELAQQDPPAFAALLEALKTEPTVDGAAYRFAHTIAAGFAPKAMNRGRWLAKLGIVKDHIDSLAPSGAEAEPATGSVQVAAQVAMLDAVASVIEQADVTDPDMRDMLGLAPLPVTIGEPLPVPLDAAAGVVPAEALPPVPTSASSAEPAPPAPELMDLGAAFRLLREATDLDDAELSKRLGNSRSTLHNYLSGRTQKVKCAIEQARVLQADIDVRVAKLRRAAEIFAQVR